MGRKSCGAIHACSCFMTSKPSICGICRSTRIKNRRATSVPPILVWLHCYRSGVVRVPHVMPLDFGPIFPGVTRTPVLGRAARLRALAAVGSWTIFIAFRAGLLLGTGRRALVLPGTTADAGPFCIFCHSHHLLSDRSMLILPIGERFHLRNYPRFRLGTSPISSLAKSGRMRTLVRFFDV